MFSEMRKLLNEAHLEIIKKREYRGARESDVVNWLAEYVENNFVLKSTANAKIAELESFRSKDQNCIEAKDAENTRLNLRIKELEQILTSSNEAGE